MLELVSIYIFHTKQSILKPINLLNQEIVYLQCLLKSKKSFKKLSNVFNYIKAFVVIHNIKRMLKIKYDAKDQAKIQKPLIEYLLNHFQEIFAFQ